MKTATGLRWIALVLLCLSALIAFIGLLPLTSTYLREATRHAFGTGASDRAYTVSIAVKIAEPVLEAGAARELRRRMPVKDFERDLADFTHLEAVGRTLVGLAPWLELGPSETTEGRLRVRYAELAVKTIAGITDPASPDFANFNRGSQPLVDAAFLAHALLRAPTRLWDALTASEQANVVAALRSTRVIKPSENNWLLFAAMVEAALWQFTGEYQRETILYALDRHEDWYKGDGTYGDGPEFRWDYYNSYVIQPMILAVLDVAAAKRDSLAERREVILARARRYAAVQEQLVSPEGFYPVIGRSSAYRMGAFQSLADISLRRTLSKKTPPAAVRGALTAIVRQLMEAPGTFDEKGWLNVGVAGHQPSLRERYISTGSLYLCTAGLLHLGLPEDDPFWTSPAVLWTQARIWAGENLHPDRAYREPAREPR